MRSLVLALAAVIALSAPTFADDPHADVCEPIICEVTAPVPCIVGARQTLQVANLIFASIEDRILNTPYQVCRVRADGTTGRCRTLRILPAQQ